MRGIQRWLALVARRCPSGCVERMGEALRHSCERGLKRPSGTGGDQVAQLLRRDARFHSQVIGDVLQPLEHSRHLSLREQVDLQVEVAAFVGLPRQAVLLANTKSARKMASRDTVMVRNGQENGSNGRMSPTTPEFTATHGRTTGRRHSWNFGVEVRRTISKRSSLNVPTATWSSRAPSPATARRTS